MYARRGWDLGMKEILQSFFEDEAFRAAAAAHTSDKPFQDDAHLFSGVYFRNLDADTGTVWSTRSSADACGMYALGQSGYHHMCTVCVA